MQTCAFTLVKSGKETGIRTLCSLRLLVWESLTQPFSYYSNLFSQLLQFLLLYLNNSWHLKSGAGGRTKSRTVWASRVSIRWVGMSPTCCSALRPFIDQCPLSLDNLWNWLVAWLIITSALTNQTLSSKQTHQIKTSSEVCCRRRNKWCEENI